MSRPIIALDFDGCVHQYNAKWAGAHVIPDPPIDGALDFIRQAIDHFRICVFSSRCVEESETTFGGVKIYYSHPNWDGILAMIDWFERHGLERAIIDRMEFWAAKPPAHVTIDDRAVQFAGDWSRIDIQALREFRPWNHHLRHPDAVT